MKVLTRLSSSGFPYRFHEITGVIHLHPRRNGDSKQLRCRHCSSAYTPMPRSYSMQVRHPSQSEGDSYHVVALKSSTLGVLRVEEATDQDLHRKPAKYYEVVKKCEEKQDCENGDDRRKKVELSMEVIEAKTWSNMIEDKIPKFVSKTPIRTPPGEPETINEWELMKGLEDASPLHPLNHHRSFSFGVVGRQIQGPLYRPNSVLQEYDIESSKPMGVTIVDTNLSTLLIHQNGSKSPNPTWLQMAENDLNFKSVTSDFDPEIISTFRKSFEDISAPKKTNEVTIEEYKHPKHCCDKVVVYFTSLRGVRKTYEDCCHVRAIMKGLRVRADERDVSMHSGFKDELKQLLRDELNWTGINLPRVFVGRKYIGGAEEIKKLHEDGQLEKLLGSCEKVSAENIVNVYGGGRVTKGCDACGDVRFVPCDTCSGSCKIYHDDESNDEESSHEDEARDGDFGFRRCANCNENGLIRCPVCCY